MKKLFLSLALVACMCFAVEVSAKEKKTIIKEVPELHSMASNAP